MYNKITSKLYTMFSIFKNDNDWNEKSIVGFIAFMIMCLFALLDLLINETIYHAFSWIVIGCFGIAGVEKFAGK